MADTQNSKRKPAHDGDRNPKRSKGGNAGQWQTPNHKAKLANRREQHVTVQPGDQGIWVTCTRGKEARAVVEFQQLCDEYGKLMYGIAPPSEEADSDDEDDDIESSIQKELDGLKKSSEKSKVKRTFKTIHVRMDCVFFVKVRQPVEPVELVRRICEDAKRCTNPRERKSKFLMRLWPVTATDKASENGVERATREALASTFDLKDDKNGQDGQESQDGQGEPAQAVTNDDGQKPAYTYAIRDSIRANSTLNHDDLVKQVASFVGPRHKVNLSSPDKVVLVDVFQNCCGVGVVDGKDWDGLKKFNLNELYKMASDAKPPKSNGKSDKHEASEVSLGTEEVREG